MSNICSNFCKNILTRTNIRVIISTERRDNMELIKSKGMVIFLVVVLTVTIISSINTKKYDESNKDVQESYISMNLK